MKITITTTVDQDLGIETMQALAKDGSEKLPLDQFAAGIIQDFLNNLTPRIAQQGRTALKQAIDTATDQQLAAISAELAKP